ncbi:hypothetical protein [Leuconostoc falkenbergense]|uniref:hypothetical protein n=1 Tax=Leuconostoc falkenbergense TaxID=2766470 RepID=UPI003F9AEF76
MTKEEKPKLTSKRSREHMVAEGRDLIKRFDKHKEYYKDIKSIQHFKSLLKKWIDFQLN